jgi:hypothetical protein
MSTRRNLDNNRVIPNRILRRNVSQDWLLAQNGCGGNTLYGIRRLCGNRHRISARNIVLYDLVPIV